MPIPRRDDAPRDLLFGLLALQNGMVDKPQLVAAFGAWTASPGRAMADLLVEQGGLTTSRRALLEALLAEHLAAHGGDAEKSLAAVDLNPSTRESLAAAGGPEVEATLHHVASAAPGQSGDADRTASYAVGTATSEGLRFRILRPHARGGLGAVFVALDAELHREVALKQILEKHADDPVSRARFLLEAEITGGLEHPGIVTVYGMGAYADGRPYYAMRFIRGESLKEAVDRFHADLALKQDPGRRSLELRKLLRRFTDMCNAVDYAHSRGVIHRDLKPANVIVGNHGETLVVDWGLAKAIGRAEPGADSVERTMVPSSASGSVETLPGSAMGTPAYMSPEQAEGDLEHLGPRSDVYSLGGTLYYLLTGKPPREGELFEVLRAAQRGEVAPPRRLDPTIDRALEAICLKAMAPRPDDRYATARALSEDLERWMADEPVSAWREPFSRRARRWARRNRTKVTAAAVALLAGVVGLSAILVVQTQAKAEIARALGREKRANEELSRSKAAVQARYELAVEAIRAFHTGVSEDFLLKEEKFKALRDRLLRSAEEFYGRLGALLGKDADLASRRALAQSNFELAELTDKVGRREDALAAHRAVLAAREALAAEPGAGAAAKVDVARSLFSIARLLENRGQTAEALSAYRRSESVLADLPGAESSVKAALAECRSRLGWVLYTSGRYADALAAYRLARADQESLAAAPEATKETRRALADTVNRVGVLLVAQRDQSAAEAAFREALAIHRKLAEGSPAEPELRNSLAHSYMDLGIFLSDSGKPTEAQPPFREALRLYQKLVDDNPAVVDFRFRLAWTRSAFGTALVNSGKASESEAELRKAMSLLQKLVDDNPAVTDFRSRLALSHNNLGLLLSQTGKASEAEAELRQTMSLLQKLVDDNPAVTDFRSSLALSHKNFGWLLSQTGKASEAEAELRQTMSLFQKLADDNPAVTDFRSSLALSHKNFGWLLSQTGRPTEAEAELRQAMAVYRKLSDDNPAVTDFRSSLADSHGNLGWLLSQTGRPMEAEAELRRAMSLFQKLSDDNPAVTDFRSRLADSQNNLGWLLSRTGRPTEAEVEHRQAMAIQQKQADDNPNVPSYRDGAANTANNLSVALRRLGRPAEARELCERAALAREALVKEHPKMPDYRAGLAENYLNRGLARRDLGDPAGAAADLRRARGTYEALPSLTGEQWFLSACARAALAGLAGQAGSGMSAALAAGLADAAMAALHKAVAMGYRDPDAYRTEDALDPIRRRDDFKLLLMDLAMPPDPFAAAR